MSVDSLAAPRCFPQLKVPVPAPVAVAVPVPVPVPCAWNFACIDNCAVSGRPGQGRAERHGQELPRPLHSPNLELRKIQSKREEKKRRAQREESIDFGTKRLQRWHKLRAFSCLLCLRVRARLVGAVAQPQGCLQASDRPSNHRRRFHLQHRSYDKLSPFSLAFPSPSRLRFSTQGCAFCLFVLSELHLTSFVCSALLFCYLLSFFPLPPFRSPLPTVVLHR